MSVDRHIDEEGNTWYMMFTPDVVTPFKKDRTLAYGDTIDLWQLEQLGKIVELDQKSGLVKVAIDGRLYEHHQSQTRT